jgi:5S rRNA maturation endonuclease (ribonuclease M5)
LTAAFLDKGDKVQLEISLDPARLENVKRHGDGSIHAACPACRAAGSDKSGNHLKIEPGGKFGCAAHPDDRKHRQEIFRLAGIKTTQTPPTNGRPKEFVCAYDYTDASGNLSYQVLRYKNPKGFRQRQPDGKGGWIYKMDGVVRVLYRLPEVLKAKSAGKPVVIVEGEKDADCLAKHGFTATCNVGGAGKWQDGYTETLRDADVNIIADKDAPGRAHAALVASKLHGVAKSVRVLELPDTNDKPVKDTHDYFAADGTAESLILLVDTAPIWTPAAPDSNYSDIAAEYFSEENADDHEAKSIFTIRTPDEILEMVFGDDDIIIGDRIIAEAQSCVIAAAGGSGKSRLVIQIAACVATGRKFLNFATGKPDSNWIFIQTENSNRRLQSDLRPLKSWLGDDWPKFAVRVKFHTVENDTDTFVNLDSPEAVANIQAAITLHAPDIIVIDPLNDFAIGDLNKDADMKLTLQTLSRICRKGNPKRAIVVLHHALTGKAGASKATGFDRASFGRNSKTLHAWTRAQINLAPVDPDTNDRLIVACGKCSNGREFQTFAVRLNPDMMIYECDPTVDVSQWEQDITGAKDTTPLMNPDRVRELCAVMGSSKATLAKSIMDDCGCYRGSAYRYITRAEQAKKITLNKSHEKYFKK